MTKKDFYNELIKISDNISSVMNDVCYDNCSLMDDLCRLERSTKNSLSKLEELKSKDFDELTKSEIFKLDDFISKLETLLSNLKDYSIDLCDTVNEYEYDTDTLAERLDDLNDSLKEETQEEE